MERPRADNPLRWGMDQIKEQLAAVEESRAFTDASSFRKVEVHGSEALSWLHDLVTSDVGSLLPGGSQRALLLTPTGRIRADFNVSRTDDQLLLLQDDVQPNPIDQLLSPYVLGSGVELLDITAASALVDAARWTRALGGTLHVFHVQGQPRELLQRLALRVVGPLLSVSQAA